MMMAMKNPVTTSSCSATPPSSAPPSIHPSPAPPMGSSKSAAEPQPMDLDCMKSKNPPQICYNCNKPGHIACNCPEPHMHRVHNADPLSLETTQGIVEAVRSAVREKALNGEEATGATTPVRSALK